MVPSKTPDKLAVEAKAKAEIDQLNKYMKDHGLGGPLSPKEANEYVEKAQANADEETAKQFLKTNGIDPAHPETVQEYLKSLEAQAKAKVRYQVFKSGSRSWRLDTTDGSKCLLLTLPGDLDNPRMKALSCEPKAK